MAQPQMVSAEALTGVTIPRSLAIAATSASRALLKTVLEVLNRPQPFLTPPRLGGCARLSARPLEVNPRPLNYRRYVLREQEALIDQLHGRERDAAEVIFAARIAFGN